jgi:uncharacterized protein (DUF1810 family)
MIDVSGLDRFVVAQVDTYETALYEIKRGAKRSHWMWFIFPQITGLGSSTTAHFYAIRSIEEAKAYLEHPLLGPRLRASVEALQDLSPTTAEAVFGSVDAMKLRSSLTLFEAAQGRSIFSAALDRWFDGRPDPATLQRLSDGR